MVNARILTVNHRHIRIQFWIAVERLLRQVPLRHLRLGKHPPRLPIHAQTVITAVAAHARKIPMDQHRSYTLITAQAVAQTVTTMHRSARGIAVLHCIGMDGYKAKAAAAAAAAARVAFGIALVVSIRPETKHFVGCQLIQPVRSLPIRRLRQALLFHVRHRQHNSQVRQHNSQV